MESQKLKVAIPFGGFYASEWEYRLDETIERELDEMCMTFSRMLSEDEVRVKLDAFQDNFSHHRAFKHLARDVVVAVEQAIQDECGWSPRLTFENMTSPREYNFNTDRIICTISLEDVWRLFYQTQTDVLKDLIYAKFTSRDGFISYYSNNYADWTGKPFEQWDHNEIGTLLEAYCLGHVDLLDIDMGAVEYAASNGMFDEAVWAAIPDDVRQEVESA